MMRSTALLGMLVCFAGCYTGPPSMNFFRPFDAVQVPAPGTHTYGQPSAPTNYYPRGANGGRKVSQAGSITQSPSASAAASLSETASTNSPKGNSATGNSDSGRVMQAAYESDSSPVREAPIRIIEPGASSNFSDDSPEDGAQNVTAAQSLAATAGGMRVNDATQAREPRLFSPPPNLIEISQLPPSGSYSPGVMSRLRGVAQPTAARALATQNSPPSNATATSVVTINKSSPTLAVDSNSLGTHVPTASNSTDEKDDVAESSGSSPGWKVKR